jgi:hypothetical protein
MIILKNKYKEIRVCMVTWTWFGKAFSLNSVVDRREM